VSAPLEPATGSREQDERLARRAILRVRADNPGPLTLSGTNTWIVGESPTWIVDPGPRLPAHLQRLCAEIDARGGLGGVALTHDHADHSEAVRELLERHPAPLAGGRGEVDVPLGDGVRFGPFEALAAPGHAPDHFALIGHRACFSGDAVLGEGSVFIAPHPGALAGYLLALSRLRLREDFDVLCPGHGPPIWEARAKLDEYVAHRLERERRVTAALDEGRRSTQELLESAWSDAPRELFWLAEVTLAAHLDKLEEDGALPTDVQRPSFEGREW
jgi:glyoxylase-like metal-dependent hydrolase (beta-lactamase superfamily II)